MHAGWDGGAQAAGAGISCGQVDVACMEWVQALVRQRVLGLLERRGLLSRATVAVMQGWGQWRFFCALGRAGRSAG